MREISIKEGIVELIEIKGECRTCDLQAAIGCRENALQVALARLRDAGFIMKAPPNPVCPAGWVKGPSWDPEVARRIVKRNRSVRAEHKAHKARRKKRMISI